MKCCQIIKVLVITVLAISYIEALNETTLLQTTANSSLTISNTTSDIVLSHPLSSHSVNFDDDLRNKSLNSSRQEKRLNYITKDCLCSENVTSDSGSCPGRRLISNPKCNCQLICAKQSGDSCSSQSPCDTDFGLECNPDIAVCQGKLLVQKFDITHNSLKIRWRSLKLSEISPNTSVLISVIPSSGSTIEWTKIENESNFINKSVAEIGKLRPNTGYYVRVEENGVHETVIARTLEHSLNENAPKVLVTQRSPTSISIAFDDFKLPNYESGYVVQYKSIKDILNTNKHNNQNNLTSNTGESDWIQIQANNTPFVTIKELRPHSAYQIQVLVWEDIDTKKLGLGSEIITVFTEDGCFRNNTTYAIGEEFFEGCDLRCICRGSDEGECSDRCNQPFVRAGTLNGNPKCTETPSPDDTCCVSVKCSNHPQEGRTNEAVGFSDKPGFCPNMIEGKDVSSVKCKEECSHDYHCTGLKKCCKTLCGGTICANSVPKKMSCENLKCGPNAFCKMEENTPSTCICEHGFSGDPNDMTKGCIKNPRTTLMCFYKDNHYSPGQSFNDSCLQCICSEALEVECSDRCAHKTNDLVPSDCTLIIDPKDDCCKILDCKTGIANTTAIIDEKPLHKATNNSSSQHSHHSMPKPMDGCKHNNQTYTEGDSFFIDCQLRCLCQSQGRLQCVPRCALDPGYDETYCRLVTDPDDPECCKISVCDKKDTISDKPEILIDSAEAFNSTSVKLRVMIPGFKNGDLGSNLKLFLSIISVNETESEKDNELRDWEAIDIVEEAIRVIATDIYEVDVGSLTSQTDYLMRVKVHNASSNTVFVRTYPPGIDITFNGCFHGNRTIEVGQVFYEGDCEYKCVCREGGLRECEERCPIYIDTVGYENCDWGPAPDDPCCTVPICDKTNKKNTPHDPDAEPFCISEAGKVYKIGQSWDTGTDCLKKSCQCALLPNGTTAVQCKGGCATLPVNARQPSPQCPSPQIVQPDDPCICPYVVCHNNLNPLDLPEKNSPSPDKKFCEFKGRKIAIGEEIYDNCRAVCHCDHDARLDCAAIECPHNFAPHVSDCLEWDIDPHFIPTPPNCCPQPKCKNDGSCSFAGIRFPNFKHIPQELLPCGTRCVCSKGKVDCENRCPSVPDIPPPHLPCPPAMAYRGHLPGDNCCLHWLCRDQEKSTNECSHNGKRYKLSEQWDDKGVGFKRRCQCKLTNGIPHVQCHPGGCPQITDRFLQPTVDCPNPSIIIPDDPVILCPYVICNDSKDTGRDLEHVNIVAINSTSARIRFTLPSLLVGLIGHAELHYTTDLNIPRSQWNIQKFARPKRLFDTPNIEYHLGNLSPDTTYFFQIQVIIEALQSGPESEIYKLYLPPIPSSATTSTTTTTVPPMIMLDVQLNAVSNDFSTLKISWRQFSQQEKKFIDGIQIRYKKAEQDENEWQFTQVLHRDVKSYVLRDLQPGTAYAVDLVFTPNPDIQTHIISTKPIVIDMPSEPKDEFDINVSLTPNDVNVDAFETQIQLKDLPQPINKYINVVKISYRSDESMQLLHAFRIPNESGKLILDGLEPNRRYKAWIDLYLANGKTVSSNAIEFTTKERPPKIHKIDTSSNEAEALRENEVMDGRYLYCLVVVSMFAAVTGIGFIVVLYFLLRKQSTAKAPITRAPSESAYDNPTYKTYEVGERPAEENMKNGTIQA